MGFQSVADELADSLLKQATDKKGLVVSIEGEWGSGKSSLVNLLADALGRGDDQSPEIVWFEPWLVGDRDGMLGELMSDLASAAAAIEAPGKSQAEALKDGTAKVAKKLLGYASNLSRGAATAAQLADKLGVPFSAIAAHVLDAAGNATDALDQTKTLSLLKKELSDGLGNLSRRVVVIVDDLDRLEPREAVEIVRLIRAVANFPNVIYVLCFDRKNLAKSLEQALHIDDGTSFLEKIIQVSFHVPQPEAYDLRRWFRDECLALYNSLSASRLPEGTLDRLALVCHMEGGLLKTPRDVVRALNAIRLYWPPISDKVDFPDLVWLQMVKLRDEGFYSWIETYLAECAAVEDGAFISEADQVAAAEELNDYVDMENIAHARSISTLRIFVPGINTGPGIHPNTRLFNNLSMVTQSFVKDRRLGSNQHSRYYFAFTKLAGALEDSEVHSFISRAGAGENIEDDIRRLIEQERPQGGTKFDVLLDRLEFMDKAELPNNAIPSILYGLANCMDGCQRKVNSDKLSRRASWRASGDLFVELAARQDEFDRTKVIENVFSNGAAIGWLMAHLLPGQILTPDRFEPGTFSEGSSMFSDQQLQTATRLLLNRFETTDRDKIIDAPELVSLMKGWQIAGDTALVWQWAKEQMVTDNKFLKFLSACRGWTKSDKTYYPLNRRDLKNFMDFDEALARLKGMSEDSGRDPAQIALAKELLAAASIGKDK